jgi:hypothetical protein
MINQGQFSQANAGIALTNTVTATDISPGANITGQAFAFAAGALQPGLQLRVRAKGLVSTTGTPTLTVGIYFGGVSGTALASTGALTTLSGLGAAVWALDADVRVDGVGSSGTLRTLGTLIGITSAVATLPAAGVTPAVTVNTSGAAILTLGATWGTASTGNTIQVITFAVERLDEGAS